MNLQFSGFVPWKEHGFISTLEFSHQVFVGKDQFVALCFQ